MKKFRSEEYSLRLEEARRLARRIAEKPPYDPRAAAELLKVKVEFAQLDGLDGYVERRKNEGWCAVISSRAAETRQRFTLAHELCHVLLMRDAAQGKAVPFIRYRTTGLTSSLHQDPQEEALCNAFASEFLMPRDCLRPMLANSHFGTDLILTIASRYRVSIQAAANKAIKLSAKKFSGCSLWKGVELNWYVPMWWIGIRTHIKSQLNSLESLINKSSTTGFPACDFRNSFGRHSGGFRIEVAPTPYGYNWLVTIIENKAKQSDARTHNLYQKPTIVTERCLETKERTLTNSFGRNVEQLTLPLPYLD